ncbi:DUF6950 family protein [Shewanella sp. SE1]|uniref:DUF6950 family protein n=1 Tax=Shewanella sp. SE1 TaxID=2705014 RepID=UPI00138F0D61|nr:hypothetical protein [Shewanella sp. SE1]NDO73083.1 hypothetical protein [Shewanella sp. SE1]
MNEKQSAHLFNTLNEYNNQPLEYGKRDCHLLFLTVYQYTDIMSKVKNRYTTIRGGLRVASSLFNNGRIPYKNLDQILEHDFREIDTSGYLQLGDCVYNRESHIMGIVTYDGIFMATLEDNCFTLNTWDIMDKNVLNGFRAFRKITK